MNDSETTLKNQAKPCYLALIFWWGPVLLLVASIVSRAPINSSFWLDETISAWLIRFDLPLLIEKSLQFQAQSPLYFVLLKEWASLWGSSSEVTLRALSCLCAVLSILAAASIIYRLQKVLLNTLSLPTTQLLAWSVLTILSSEDFLRAAFSARPYSAALLASLLSTSLFISLLARPTTLRCCLYSISLLLTFYLHYLYLGIVLVHLSMLTLGIRNKYIGTGNRAKIVRNVSICWSLCILGMIPGIAHQLHWRERMPLSFAAQPSTLLGWIKNILPTFMPRQILVYLPASLIVGLLFAENRGHIRQALIERSGSWAALSLIWLLLPCVVLTLLTIISGNTVLVPRYGVWGLGGIIMVVVFLLLHLLPGRATAVAFATWASLCIPLELQRRWHPEGWREAASSCRDSSESRCQSILVASGLRETNSIEYLHNADTHPYLTAPFTVYLPGARLVPVSVTNKTPESQEWLNQSVRAASKNRTAMIFGLRREIEGAIRLQESTRTGDYNFCRPQHFGQVMSAEICSTVP